MVVKTKTRLAKTAVASFGAALTSLNVAPQLEAAIIDLSGNFSPTQISSDGTASVDFIPDSIFGTGPDFYQSNSSASKYFYATITSQIVGFNERNFGDLISALQVFDTTVSFSYDDDTTLFLGFLTADNRVGWIEMELENEDGGGRTLFLGAAFNTSFLPAALSASTTGHLSAGLIGPIGAPIFAGQLPVPEPSTAALAGLAVLALGAGGVKRLRRDRPKNSQLKERPARECSSNTALV